jgi:polyphosphate glucokinase
MTMRPSDDPIVPQAGVRIPGRGLGIDVGGTGIKAGVVDLSSGELVSEQLEERTPQPSTPEACIETIAGLLDRLSQAGALTPETPAGCGVPAPVKFGRLKTAANIDDSWIDAPAEEMLAGRLGREVLLINDADAAGLAEMTYGAAAGNEGTVMFLGIGTGIGTALFIEGYLLPNTELGHVEFRGQDAETLISGAARERRGLDWKTWADDFNEYVAHMERYFWPDLIVIGGGVSRAWNQYEGYLESRAQMIPARLLQSAGTVGAALAGANAARQRRRAISVAERGRATATTPASVPGGVAAGNVAIGPTPHA